MINLATHTTNKKKKFKLTSILLELHATYYEALVGCHHVKITACASEHGGNVVEYTIRFGLIHKEFHICIEQITLRDMNAFDESET